MIIVDASYLGLQTALQRQRNLTLKGSRKRQYLPHS